MASFDASATVSPGTVIFSLAVFSLLYGALAVVWYYLMHRYTVVGPEPGPTAPGP